MDSVIERLIQVGTVSAVDAGKKKARVLFQTTNMTSDWLSVLQRTGESVAVTTKSAGDPTHTHEASGSVTSWMPKIGSTVVVVYLPIFNSDGFIIGQI